jgi:hypothetical protein
MGLAIYSRDGTRTVTPYPDATIQALSQLGN